MAKFEQIHIPVVYEELSSSRVLTMEFVKGIKIADPDGLREAGLDPSQLGATFMRAIIKQVLIDGFFHADPHPGNVLVDPASNQIVFLDLGLIGRLRRSSESTCSGSCTRSRRSTSRASPTA